MQRTIGQSRLLSPTGRCTRGSCATPTPHPEGSAGIRENLRRPRRRSSRCVLRAALLLEPGRGYQLPRRRGQSGVLTRFAGMLGGRTRLPCSIASTRSAQGWARALGKKQLVSGSSGFDSACDSGSVVTRWLPGGSVVTRSHRHVVSFWCLFDIFLVFFCTKSRCVETAVSTHRDLAPFGLDLGTMLVPFRCLFGAFFAQNHGV